MVACLEHIPGFTNVDIPADVLGGRGNLSNGQPFYCL